MRRLVYMLRKILILSLLFFLAVYTFSWEAGLFTSSFVNIPEGWYVLGNEPDKVTFAAPDDSAYFQIKNYPGNRFDRAIDIYSYIISELGAAGEGEEFLFNTRESYFAGLTFNSGGYNYQGYLVCIEGEIEDTVLLSFSNIDDIGTNNDFILSAMDSYSMNESGLKTPGPVSQYYYPWPGRNKSINYLSIKGEEISLSFDLEEINADRVLVEREARVLIQYTDSELSDSAWARYYRIIYRDNYARLKRIARIVSGEISKDFDTMDDLEKSSALLSWIQNFEYIRTGTLSDFMSPIDTVLSAAGDCDSRALLYLILLDYNGIDGILMVSSAYSHSLAGIAVEGRGAHFFHEGLDYLIAETTDNVSIGLIDRDMADPSLWMGITF